MHDNTLISRNMFWKIFGRIGLQSFGGPAAQISVMHRILVDETKQLTESQFLRALSFCMLLPGPEAMQLATYAGWRLRGISGGIIAGLLFVLPGAAVMLSLAILYATYGQLEITQTLFLGVKAAVLAIILEALMKVSKKALHGVKAWVLAGAAFFGLFFLSIPFPFVILAAALTGFFFWRSSSSEAEPAEKTNASLQQTLYVILVGAFLWFAPLLILEFIFEYSLLSDIGLFFSKLAMVTFGGAYAVLAYMSQDVVTQLGWLTAKEMLDGLGLAETTPGPLILVTEFVGFLAAYKTLGIVGGIAAACVTLWVTFVPCFIWIFAGAPYIERLTTMPKLNGALSAITAAVVGVILNLSLWFALHVLFSKIHHEKLGYITVWRPELSSLNPDIVLIFLLSSFLLFVLKWGIARLLITAGSAAFVLSLV
jgi:chromate transporter